MKKTLINHASFPSPAEVALRRMDGDEQGAYTVNIGDVVLQITVERGDDFSGRLCVSGRSIPYCAARSNNHVHVWIDGRTYAFELHAKGRQAKSVEGVLPSALVAPMPGTVRAIRVAVGDAFAAHDPLVILESMKMEMTLSAPAAGRVAAVHCKNGALVDMGAVLMDLEREQVDARVS